MSRRSHKPGQVVESGAEGRGKKKSKIKNQKSKGKRQKAKGRKKEDNACPPGFWSVLLYF